MEENNNKNLQNLYKKIQDRTAKIEDNITKLGKIKEKDSKIMADETTIQKIQSMDMSSNIYIIPTEDILPFICKSDAISKIIDSTNYLKEKYCEMMETMKNTKSKNELILKTTQEIKSSVNDFEKIENEIMKDMQPNDALKSITNYYDTISEMEIESNTFTNIIQEFIPIMDNLSQTEGFWDKFMRIKDNIKEKINSFKERISSIIQRIKGSVSEIGHSLIDQLESLKNLFKNMIDNSISSFSDFKNIILKELNSISKKLHEFISKLIDRMFDFLTKFGSLAKSKGFPVSKIEIKIPTIKLEFLGVFGFSIPIPKLDPPEMTVTLTPPT